MKKLLLLITFIMPIFMTAQPINSYEEIIGTYVYDRANVLPDNEELKINNLISSFFDTVQIAVITANSLEGYEPYEYATFLGSKLGVGQKHFSNGILILVSPGERSYFTAVGTDIEGYLTDIQTGRLQRDLLVPYLKRGDWAGGIQNLTSGIIGYLKQYSYQIKQEELNNKANFENRVANGAPDKNFDRYVPSEINKPIQKEDNTFMGISILLGITIIIGLIIFFLYKHNKEKARKQAIDDAYDKIVKKVEETKKTIAGATKLGFVFNNNILDYLKTINIGCVDEASKVFEIDRFSTTFERGGIYYNEIESAKILINNYIDGETIINKNESFVKLYLSYLDKASKTHFYKVEKDKLDKLKEEFNDYFSVIKPMEVDLKARNHEAVAKSVSITKSIIGRIEIIFALINKVLDNDKTLYTTIIGFKSKTESILKNCLSYCYRQGVSKKTSDLISDTCHTIIGMLKNYDTLELSEKHKVYIEINEILKKVNINKAKKEWEDYEEEQRRKRDRDNNSDFTSGYLIGSMTSGSSGGFGGGGFSNGGFGGGGFSGGGAGGKF